MASLPTQRLLPKHVFSRLVNVLSHCRIRWFKNWAINRYIRKYHVNLNEAIITDINQYDNLNAFFTRHIKAELRPIDKAANLIASPADGFIQQLGQVDAREQLLSVKGQSYSLLQLLGGNSSLCQTFAKASFINIYLSPKDYHRVHIPLAGTLKAMWTIPGKLYAVNAQTVAAMPDLFVRNERVVCLFETAYGPMCVILVGAMIVSGIATTWGGSQTPNYSRRIKYIDYSLQSTPITFNKGEEIGYFEFGSTVIVLLANGKQCQWQAHLAADQTIQFGQTLGEII